MKAVESAVDNFLNYILLSYALQTQV